MPCSVLLASIAMGKLQEVARVPVLVAAAAGPL